MPADLGQAYDLDPLFCERIIKNLRMIDESKDARLYAADVIKIPHRRASCDLSVESALAHAALRDELI